MLLIAFVIDIFMLQQIGKLEGEVSLLQQELTHERDEKENLQSQIETYSSQMLQLQSQTAGGNSTIVNLKVVNDMHSSYQIGVKGLHLQLSI